MTIKECYAEMEGNYDEILTRFMKDDRIARFVLKFPKDTSFEELKTAMAAKDCETAFRAAHTLKGVAANLSLSKLQRSSSEMTEFLRAGDLEGAAGMFPEVIADYEQTVGAIARYQEANP